MERDKAIKILRIISLTLGILSMLFFLYTKIAHAEGAITQWNNTTESFPLPFGSEYYGTYSFNASEYITMKNMVTTINFNEPYVTYYKWGGNNWYWLIWVQYADENHIYNINSANTLYDTVLTHYNIVKEVAVWCDRSNGTFGYKGNGTEQNSNGVLTAIQFSTNGTANNGIYTLNKNASNYLYPIGSNMQNLGNLSKTFFTTGIDEETIGEITDVFQETQIIADSGNDTINTLTQATYKNWFQAIISTIWNTANNLVQNFKSFFAPFYNRVVTKLNEITEFFQNLIEKVTEIVEILQEYVANDLTAGGIAQVWQTNFQASYVYTLITTGNSIKTALSSLGNTNATEPVITVNLGNNTFFGQTGEYIFRFGWYENIRTGVVTFITAFWLVGLGIHLFTQIPNMIHGVSGTAHGIQNAGGTAIHKQ